MLCREEKVIGGTTESLEKCNKRLYESKDRDWGKIEEEIAVEQCWRFFLFDISCWRFFLFFSLIIVLL